MMHIPLVCFVLALAVTLVAAVIDARTGHIPNWLTFPAVLAGPLLWTLHGGFWARGLQWPQMGSFGGSLLSLFICAFPGLVLWFFRALGAGDVKLFAALGSLLLVDNGMLAVFYGFCAMCLFAMARLAWEGMLLRTLGNSLFLLLNLVLPRRYRRPLSRESMTKLRFGPAIFAGTAISILSNHRFL